MSVSHADAVPRPHLHMLIIAQPSALYKAGLKLAEGSAGACCVVAAAVSPRLTTGVVAACGTETQLFTGGIEMRSPR